MSVAREWVRITISDQMRDYAQKLRAKRDEQFASNVFPSRDTDWRWVGELGECAVHKWLSDHGTPFRWMRDNPGGQPDFTVCDETVDIKTSKRTVEIKPNYEIGITGHNAAEQHAETLLFCCYEIPTNTLLIMGALPHEDFLKHARYFGPGEKVHEKFTVREGSNLYNVHISQMIAPLRWLEVG